LSKGVLPTKSRMRKMFHLVIGFALIMVPGRKSF